MFVKQLAFLVVMLCCILAHGNSGFAVKGVGRLSCDQFVELRQEKSAVYEDILIWMDGFATSYNQSNTDTVDIFPWQSSELVASLVEIECNRLEVNAMVVAFLSVLQLMHPSRLDQQSDITSVSVGDQSAKFHREIVDRLQSALIVRGFLKVRTEGFDEVIQNALAEFQRDEGLAPSGFPDQLTLLAVFR